MERQADRGIDSQETDRGGRHTRGQTKKQTARETDRWRNRQTEG